MSELFTPIHPNLPKSNSRFEPTGESIGGRFSEMPLPANDEGYEPLVAPHSKVALETQESKQTPSKYLALALDQNNGGLEAAIEAGKHDAIEQWLVKNDFISIEEGAVVMNNEKGLATLRGEKRKTSERSYLLKKWHIPSDLRNRFNLPSEEASVTAEDFFSYLNNRLARLPGSDEMLPVTTLPSTLSQLASGTYPKCHIKPWEIPFLKRSMWYQPLTLSDGTETNFAELHVAELIQKYQIVPEGNGRFLVTNPHTGTTQSVVTNELAEGLFPVYGSAQTDAVTLRNNTADFAHKYFRNLDRLNILNTSHFRKTTVNFETSTVAPSDRRLSEGSSSASLQTPGGKTILYYIGRDKIAGTDIPFDRKSMVLRYLDNRTIGIVRIDNGLEEVLCTFPLASPEEVENRREQTREKYLAKGKSLKDQDLGSRTFISGAEMKGRVHRYKTADYLPQYPDESPNDYANRVARLSDARLVSKDAREFFQRSGIGLHQLPWAEQLAASSILLDPRFKKDEVAAFCQQYGIDGLRTFISSTDGDINRFILTMGSRLEPDVASTVFKKHSEILDATKQISSYVESAFPQASDPNALRAIESKILQKARSLLKDFYSVAFANGANTSAHNQKRSIVLNHLKGVEELKVDIEILKATFKTLKEAGTEIDLTELRDLDWQTAVNPEDLSATDKEAMEHIYRGNYPSPQYTDEFRDMLIKGLMDRLQNPTCRFYLLKHKNGDIIGFNAYHDTEPDAEGRSHAYFGAFNINPKYGQSKLGEAMLDATLASEGEGKIIDAHCDTRSPISAKYIESGFIATGFESIAGSPSFSIVRDPERNQTLLTKRTSSTLTPEVLETLATAGSPRENIRVIKFTNKDAFPEQSLREGFVVTHYRFHKDGSRLVVFERPQSIIEVTHDEEELATT